MQNGVTLLLLARRAASGSALLCLLSANPLAAGQDRLELVPVATLPGGFAFYWPGADCNHNGLFEIYGTCDGVLSTMLVCEDTSGNEFKLTRLAPGTGWIHDLGFRDCDSLAEVLTARAQDTLRLSRALARDSYPTHQVWKAVTPYQVYSARFCDLDLDGHQDIVASGRQPMGAYVYENRGADSWAEVPFPRRVGPDIMARFAVGDFDLDGRMELAGGNADGDLLLYECIGDDQYARVCSLNYSPGGIEDYDHVAGNDMDNNGLPELVSLFRKWGNPVDSCTVRIYEEPGHNQFVCVCSLEFRYNPFFGGGCLGVGDLDGDSVQELCVSTNLDLRVFKATGIHQYTQTWQLDRHGIHWMQLYDVNRDGRDELVFSVPDTTFIYEDTNGLGSAVFEKLPQQHAVSVQPTIARLGMPVVFSDIEPDAAVEIHAVDGRLVSRQPQVRQSNWTWNLRDQAGNLVPAGTYFAVIRSRERLASLKLCIVK